MFFSIKLAAQFDKNYIYWAAGASGAAGLIYEVVWMRALTNTIGATSYSFSILVAAFMAGLAIGGYYGGSYISDKENALQVFGVLQLGIGLVGAITLFAMNNLSPIYAQLYYWLKASFNAFTLAQMALVFVVMLVPTTLMGATFPIAVKAWSKRQEEVGRNVGDIYSVNTWGAVIGALAAGFILIPLLGLRSTNLVANCINLGLAALVFISPLSRRLLATTAAVFLLGCFFAFLKPSPILAFSYGVADHYKSLADYKIASSLYVTLFDKDSPYGRVQVLGYSADSDRLALVNGGRFEGSTMGERKTNQKLLPYLPLAVHKTPKTVLQIGLGTGTTLNALTEDERVETIDSVEINPVVYEAVEEYFYPGLFDSPGVNAISDDARHYLLVTDRRYDVIISQPSYPTSNAVSHLFTADFYRIASKRLKEGGVFIQWLPGYLLDDPDLDSAIKTLAVVFPNSYSWIGNNTGDMFLVALKSDEGLDTEQIKKQVDSLRDPDIGLWTFDVGPDEIAALSKDPAIPINLDDNPKIEFRAARNKVIYAHEFYARQPSTNSF